MAASSYATNAEIKAYLPGMGSTSDSLFTTLGSTASRRVDRYLDRYFYADATETRYFDGTGGRILDLNHDFYSLTALKIAILEGAGVSDTTAWYTITGDGLTPVSNFWLEPANPKRIGNSADQNSKEPFYRIWIPENTYTYVNPTSYVPFFTKGRRTVSITASWGWPAVPDAIKEVTIKVAIRLFRARDSGFTGQSGGPDTVVQPLERLFDWQDKDILEDYRRHQRGY